MNRNRICVEADGMMLPVVTAGGGLPDSIMWMPPGRQSAVPKVDGERKRIVMEITPQLAEQFNAILQEMRATAASGEGDEPYIDFNHEDQERAGEVTELYWAGNDPKTGGIRARVKWSAAGSAAVLGRNYRRFSPQWALDRDTLAPIGLYVNLGGLVNRAAFQNIAPVIAGAATNNPETTMTEKEITDAIAAALKPVNDKIVALEAKASAAPATAANSNAATATAAAPDLARIVGEAITVAMKPVTDRVAQFETNVQKAGARAALQPHITRGAIGPQDNDTIAFWENAWIANAKNAEAQMAKLPGAKPSRMITVSRGADGSTAAVEPQERLMASASKLLTDSAGKMTAADAIIAAARSGQGQEDYKQFRSTWMSKSENN